MFVFNWAMFGLVGPHLQPMILLDIYNLLTEDDKVYFRKQREERFGKKLEEVCLQTSDVPGRGAGLQCWRSEVC